MLLKIESSPQSILDIHIANIFAVHIHLLWLRCSAAIAIGTIAETFSLYTAHASNESRKQQEGKAWAQQMRLQSLARPGAQMFQYSTKNML